MAEKGHISKFDRRTEMPRSTRGLGGAIWYHAALAGVGSLVLGSDGASAEQRRVRDT